jgi:hypothetical protein
MRTRVCSLLVPMLALLGPLAPGVRAIQLMHGQETAVSDLERLKANLRRAGPEGRQEREQAVIELLSFTDPSAHRLLLDVLAGPDDADGLLRFVLVESGKALANRRHAVFYPEGERRQRQAPLRRGYGIAFLRFHGDLAHSPAVAGELRALARHALLGMDEADVRSLLTDVLAGNVEPDRIAALRAAAVLRSLTYAPLIAELLEDPKLGPLARESLVRLTFVTDGFATKADFERWRKENEQATYLELAERAAWAAMQSESNRRAADQETILVLREKLVARLASGTNPAWAEILAQLQSNAARDSRQRVLLSLRDSLVRQDRASPGGSDAERGLLLDHLELRMAEAKNGGEYPLLLEVSAQLVDTAPSDRRTRVLDALVKGLSSTDQSIRVAALRGLRRHPAPENRHAVAMLLADPSLLGNAEVLDELLKTLQAKGWVAPSADEADAGLWVGGLQSVVRAKPVRRDLRDAALSALALRDKAQNAAAPAFAALVEFVADAQLEVELREKAMVQLQAHASDPARWEQYLELLAASLLDAKEERVRQKAAQLLQSLPAAPSPELQAAADTKILRAVSDRLLVEERPDPFRALVECLSKRFDPLLQRDPGPVLMPLNRAIEALAARPADPTQEFRRDTLVAALMNACLLDNLAPVHWVRALQSLATIGDRRSMRKVLGGAAKVAYLASTPQSAKDAIEIHRNAQRMVIRAALLKPPAESWSGDEARDVARAFDLLEQPAPDQTQPDPFPPNEVVLRLEVLLASGQSARVTQLARVFLREGRAAEDNARGRVARLAASALLQSKQPAEALAMLESVPTAGAEGSGPRLREEIGQALLAAGNHGEAATLLETLLSQTAPTDPSYTGRLLLAAEAVVAASPARGPELKQRLEREAGRFSGDAVPADQRERYQALMRRL